MFAIRTRDFSKFVTCHRYLFRQPQKLHHSAEFINRTVPAECGSFRNYNVTTASSKTSFFNYRESVHPIYPPTDVRCKNFVMFPPLPTSSILISQRHQQLSRRWMGAPNKHNRKKRIEKSDLDPNKQTMKPRFTEGMKKEYDAIERRFVQKLDDQIPGRNRGIECARQIVLDEKIEKKASTACGNIYLTKWIYRRFTLPLGYRRIYDVPGVVLANTLIRDGTTIRFPRYKDPKLILLEMYRYPHIRPTKTQKKYIKMDEKAEMTPEQASRILNFDDDDEFLTPDEEEFERRMIENKMFAANPYQGDRRGKT